MISPWDSPLPRVRSRGMVLLPCRFVRYSRLDPLLGDRWPHPTISGTTHGDYSSGYAIHSDKTSPKQAIAGRKGRPLRFHHPNRRLGTAHIGSISTYTKPSGPGVEQQLSL